MGCCSDRRNSSSCASNKLQSLLAKLLLFLKVYSVEVVTALYSFGASVSETTVKNLLLYKVCQEEMVTGNVSTTTCANVTADAEMEQRVQVASASMLTYSILIGHLPCVVLVLFVGHWSDRHGRRWVVLSPLIGFVATTLLYWLSASQESWQAISVVWAGVPYGITGQYTIFMMGLFCLIKDETDPLKVALRVSINDAIETGANQLGYYAGGQLLKYGGTVCVMQTSFAFAAASALYAVFFIGNGTSSGTSRHGRCTSLLDLIDVRNIREIVMVLVRPREDGKRRKLILYFLAVANVMCYNSGRQAINFLYCRLKFHLDVVAYSYLDVIGNMTGFLGFAALLPGLIKLFPSCITDDVVGLLGTAGNIAISLGYAFAGSTAAIYGVTSFTLLSYISFVAMRSSVFNCVSSEEAGKILAAYSILGAGLTSLSQVITTQLYVATISWYSGFCYLAFGIVMLANVAIYSWAHMDNKSRIVKERLILNSMPSYTPSEQSME